MNRKIYHIVDFAAKKKNQWPATLSLLTGCLFFCVPASCADSAAPSDIIPYQQQDVSNPRNTVLFPFPQGSSINSASQTRSQASQKLPRSLPLLSLAGGSPGGLEEQQPRNGSTADTLDAATDGENSEMLQPSIADLADTLQWTILMLATVTAAVVIVHRFTKNKKQLQSTHRMEYQGSLPVRGQFSLHLVTIVNRQFLVTTDRTGVKTVNALNEWDQFSVPVDQDTDGQFPSTPIDLEIRHHG